MERRRGADDATSVTDHTITRMDFDRFRAHRQRLDES